MQLKTFRIKDWVVLGITEFKAPKKISDELIDEARIIYVVQGNSRLNSANKVVELHQGDTLIMKTDNFINNWLRDSKDEETIVIVFQLSSSLLQYLYSSELPTWFKNADSVNNQSLLKVDNHPIIASYFNSLQLYLNDQSLFSEAIVNAKVKELIAILIAIDKSGETKRIFGNLFTASEYEFKDTISKNIFEDLNTEDLAFLCSMSVSSFKRKFREVYGTSPNKYISSKRLDKAQTLLRTTKLSISEIAYECGFSDVSYFSKSYKKQYNSSPSDLRK